MRVSAIGTVSAAILMLAAGVGIGIAQAGGNQPYDPMRSFGDQDVNPYAGVGQAVEQGASSDPYNVDLLVETGNLPEPGNVAETGTNEEFAEWETRGPVETGGIPAMKDDESDIEGDTFLEGRLIDSVDD